MASGFPKLVFALKPQPGLNNSQAKASRSVMSKAVLPVCTDMTTFSNTHCDNMTHLDKVKVAGNEWVQLRQEQAII